MNPRIGDRNKYLHLRVRQPSMERNFTGTSYVFFP